MGNDNRKKMNDILDPAAAKQRGGGLKKFANLKNAEGVTIKGQFFTFLKNPYVLTAILILIIIIGLLGFLFNMPGLMMGKLKKLAQDLWDGLQGHFLTTADSFINDDDVTKLAQYLVDMQYDLIGYGFVRARQLVDYPTYLELDDEYYMNSENIYVKLDDNGQEIPYDRFYYGSTGELIDNSTGEKYEETNYIKDKYGIMYWASDIGANESPDGESHTAGQIAEINDRGILLDTGAFGDDSLLRTYLMADYRISVLRNDDEKWTNEVWNAVATTFGGAPNAWSKGLIKVYEKNGNLVTNFFDNTNVANLWWNTINVKDNGTTLSIRKEYFNSPMEFSLDGWTGRYGLSLEFLLSLHLGTMAPDLVTAMLQIFDTEVQVYMESVDDAEVYTKYKDYVIDSTEENEEIGEIITIDFLNEVLTEAGYTVPIQDGALIEWVNGFALTREKCQTLLKLTGLSSPPNCVYTAVDYAVLPPSQHHYDSWNNWQSLHGSTFDTNNQNEGNFNVNYLNVIYGIEEEYLEDFIYRIFSEKYRDNEDVYGKSYDVYAEDGYYVTTSFDTLFSVRYDDYSDRYISSTRDTEEVSSEDIDNAYSNVLDKQSTFINELQEGYQLKEIPEEIKLVYNTETNKWDSVSIEDFDITEEKYNSIGSNGHTYRIEKYSKDTEWSMYGYMDDDTEEFYQLSEEEYNQDRNGTLGITVNGEIEETSAYMYSEIYKVFETGVEVDGEIVYYNEDGVLVGGNEESEKGMLVGKYILDAEGLDETYEYGVEIYYKDNMFYCYNLYSTLDSQSNFLLTNTSTDSDKYQWYNNFQAAKSDGVTAVSCSYEITLTYDSSTEKYKINFTIVSQPSDIAFGWNGGSSVLDVSFTQDEIQNGGATLITEPYLYDILYINYAVRDKTLEELVACGIFMKDENGKYVRDEDGEFLRNEDAGSCSTDTDGLTCCCSICQKYVKKVIKALALIQDTDYAYYQPYIARVVGSWFRDTYFIIPESKDVAIIEYENKHSDWNSSGAFGNDGRYVNVDEEYLYASGEYWTEYEMKTEIDENGNIIETDEYQLYYLKPDGSISDDTLEKWLEESPDAIDENGNRYANQEDAEKDGYVFVKRAKLRSLSEIQNNVDSDNGGGRDSLYLDGVLWSAYTEGAGTDTGWLKINRGESDAVDVALDMVNDEGEFYYKLTSTKSIEQEEDAIRTETNATVKNLFRYRQFYIYDGTVARAEEIQKDREKVNKLIISYFANNRDGYSKEKAVDELGRYGRYALREAYGYNTITIFTIDEHIAESWLEWQLDMYYRANNEKSLSDKEKKLFKLDELCEYGIETEFINEKGTSEKFLDANYYTLDNHSLDPRNRHLISTVNISKSSLDAFSILENVNTLDADYQYRDFKELIVELNYFDKEDLSDKIEEVFTWIVPTYSTTWPVLSIDKQNIDYGTLVHSQESIDFLIQVYERLLEEEKEYYGIEDSETEEPDSETSEESTEQKKAKSRTEETLKLLQEATSYAENDVVVSPVTGRILAYGTHSRTNVYTKELEDVGYVKIEIMGYGETQDKSKSYFTKDMLSETGLTDEEKERAVKGLNAFYDEYKDQCAGYILTIDGIDISDLKNGFVNVKNIEGESVEYKDLCQYEANEGIALYNSKEQKRREEEELAKVEAPFFINYNADYTEVNGEYFELIDGVSGYYIKEGAYLGKTQSATERTGEKNSEYTEAPGSLIEDVEVVEPSTDAILDINKLYEEYLGDTNPDYLRLILLDDESTVIDNVEDYFPGFEEESNSGIKFSGSFSEEGLYWMIVGFEGLQPSEVRNGFVAVDIGDETVTAGGSGITNWCNSYFWELGYEEYVHYKKGSNIGMEVGDVIPGNVIMDIKAVVIDAHVANVNNTFPNNNFNQCQVEALASVSYNFGYIPEPLKNAINNNSDIKEVWEHLSDSQASEYPGLVTRRKAEYKLFSEGLYSNDSGIMNFTTDTPYSDYINGDNTVTYN